MSTDPDEIRADIERTRSELSSDVDALTDKVSPGQVAHRQAQKVRSAAAGLKERVVGTVTDGAGSAASSLADRTAAVPEAARGRTRGNPLAAGLVAFGAGWLAAALLPSSRHEQDLAVAARAQAGPLVDEVKGAAQEAAANLKTPAQEAASAVKDRATEAATSVQDEGRSAVQDVKEQASAGDSHTTDESHGAHVADDPSGSTSQPA